MVTARRVWFSVLILSLIAVNTASAQSLAAPAPAPGGALTRSALALAAQASPATTTAGRDSLWNGTLIGLGAGIGAAAALDAVFCENGFGGCDFPWAAYLTLGAIGAGAGAGIDHLIGRNRIADADRTNLRVAPVVARGRRGMVASVRF